MGYKNISSLVIFMICVIATNVDGNQQIRSNAALSNPTNPGSSQTPALVRHKRLLGLFPGSTGSLVTDLVLEINNLLAGLDLTVLVFPAPLPKQFGKCFPSCLQDTDCMDAMTKKSGGISLDSLLGSLTSILSL